jgi:hypothetical protein
MIRILGIDSEVGIDRMKRLQKKAGMGEDEIEVREGMGWDGWKGWREW